MTTDPQIRIAKSGKSVFSSDPRDFVLDNRYNMFKYHSSTSTSVTINGGDSEKSTTVSHNLGYVPAFIVYYKRSDENVERILPDIPYGVGFDYYPWAYATTTGVTVGYSFANPYNRTIYSLNDYFGEWSGGSGRNLYVVGNNDADGMGNMSGAMRFASIALNKNQSISSAYIDAYVAQKGSSTSDTKMITYGINEDNTGDFGSNPMGRSRTSNSTTQNQNPSSTPFSFQINIKSSLEQIIARNNWTLGNAMGFLIINNGSPTNSWLGDTTSGSNSILVITTTGTLTVSFRVIIFKDKIA